MNEHEIMIITPEQLNEGFTEFVGISGINPTAEVITKKHNFYVIKKLPDGNYLVKNPNTYGKPKL